MTRIFAAVAVASTLVLGAAALSTAYESSGSESTAQSDILELFSYGIEAGAIVPIVLVVSLAIAVVAVWGRI